MNIFWRWGLIFGFLLGVLAALPAERTGAATYYWDTNGSTAGAGDTPSGTWNTANWSLDLAGTATVTSHTTTSGDILYFDAGPAANSGENAYTVTVSGTQAASALIFQSSGSATLTGSTISLGSGGITVLQYAYGLMPQGAATISAPISLQATQTWTNSSASSLTVAGNVANGSYDLTISGPGNSTLSGVIGSGSGGLAKIGVGTLTLTATNSFTGGTTVSGGTLDLASGGALQASTLLAPTAGSIFFDWSVSPAFFTLGGLSGAGSIALQNTASSPISLTVGSNGSTVYSGILGGTGSVIKIGTGTLTLANSSTYSGGTTISGGMLQLGNGISGQDGSLAGGITDNATLVYNLAGSQTYSGIIAGTGSLAKSGTGTLTLAGTTNTYSGGTTVSAGTLAVTMSGGLAGYGVSSMLAVNSGATLALSVGGSGWTANNISSLLSANGGGFVSGSALGIDTTLAGTGGFSYGSAIAGSMGLAKLGTNTLTLAAANIYSGGTTVSAGTLAVTTTGALAGYNVSSLLTVNSGATLALSVGGTGWTAANVGSLLSTNGGGFASGSALGIDTTNATSGFSYGAIAGSMGLTKLGSNVLTLSAASTFSGPATVSGGTLNLANGGALQGNTVVVSTSASISFDSSVSPVSFTFGGLSGSGNISLQNTASAAVALTVGGNSSSTSYCGALSGSGSLTKAGGGTLVLSGSNTYTGGTTVSAGLLTATNSAALSGYGSASAVTVNSGATLTLSVGGSGWTAASVGSLLSANNSGFASGSVLAIDTTPAGTSGFSYGSALGGNISLAKLGANALILTAANSYTGTTTVSGGTLQFGDGTSGHDGSLPSAAGIMDNAALVYNLFGSQSSSGVISGLGSLTKAGSGVLILQGASTYSGTTTVSGGTLQLGDGISGQDGSLPNTSGITTNATLSYNLAGSQGYGCVINGIGGLIKSGGGTLTLSAAGNSYTGGTTVSAGTLAVTSTSALADYSVSSMLAVGSGETLTLSVGGSGWTAANVGSLLSASGGGFASGSVLGIDTTAAGAGFSYGAIAGNMGLTKLGPNTLTLTAVNTFAGPTTVSGGTLNLANGSALQGSTVVVPTAGSISFASSVNPASFTFGGLSGAGNITLQNTAAVALTIGGNNASTTYAGVLSGSGSLTKIGTGTLGLTGSNSFSGGITVGGGALTVASSGALIAASGKNLYVGYSGPAAMTIQDSAKVSIGGELDINYQAGGATSPSVLTLSGGSLSVTGQTFVGRANVNADPSVTNAAIYQSGGTAMLGGVATVGYNGTALSLYDISGGVLNATGGLLVGGNVNNGNNGQGNGQVNIHGSGVVNISNGLQIGQDTTLATSGSLDLSGGTLAVTGSILLGSGGGIATLSRSGGSLTVSGGLTVGGNATLLLDAATGIVATSFGGGLSRSGLGTLVLIPYTGNLATTEAVSFATAPTLTNGILGSWAVGLASGTNVTGDYLTVTASGHSLATFSGYTSGFSGAGNNSVVNVSSASSTKSTSSATIYAMKVSDTATINSAQTLTLSSGGMILNGGTVTGGTLDFNDTPLIFAGSSTPGTIASVVQSSLGLVKFGPGTLVLSADNGKTLSGAVAVDAGTLNAQNSGALGSGGIGSPVTVAAGAALELQNNISVGNVAVTLNGSGTSGGGSLCNAQDNNSLAGTISLGSNSQINTVAGTLTLGGAIQDPSTPYTLTKTGSGTLVLAGSSDSAFPTSLTVAGGVLNLQNSLALGPGGLGVAVSVNSAATLQLQNGIAVPNVSLTLNGAGTGGNASLENLQGSNSLAGAITLASDSQVNVDAAADTLTLGGNVGGGFALSKGGAGTLLLSGSNSFSGAINVLSGTLSVASVNNTGSVGPLGQGIAPVVLGSSGTAATLLYTGTGTTTNRGFTLTSSGGAFSVASSLGLSGVIGGNGSLTKAGSGTLTLTAANTYSGTTTVASGTLAVGSAGAISSTTGIAVSQGALLQVTAGASGSSQLPDSGSVTLSGGGLCYVGNGSSNLGELAGSLVLNPGQSNITTSRNAVTTYTPYLRFASGSASHATGATVNFSTDGNSYIQFQSDPPVLIGGSGSGIIGGYAYFNGADFATWNTSGPSGDPTVQVATYINSDPGEASGSGSANFRPQSSFATSSARTFNSLNLTGSDNVTITGSGSLTLNSGGLIGNTTGTISGGTLKGSANGELTVNAVLPLTIASAIANNGGATALVTTGAGTLTLQGPNTYTGDTYINQGTLVYASTANVSYPGVFRGAGNLTKSATTTLTLTSPSALLGSMTVSQGMLSFNVTGGGTVANSVVLGGGTVDFAASGTIGTLSATASSGSWRGTGSVSGPVNVSGGTLTIVTSTYPGILAANGGVSVTGSATITGGKLTSAASGGLAINASPSQNLTLASVIADAAGTTTPLVKSGSGTLQLTASNTYSGGTTVAGGTLQVGNRDALGTGGLTLSGGQFDLDDFNVTVPSLSGTAGTVTNSTGSSTLTVAGSGSSSFAGSITGSGLNLALSSGTLTLCGTNSYQGGTTVAGGLLEIASVGSLPSGASLTIGSGGGVVFDAGIAGSGTNDASVLGQTAQALAPTAAPVAVSPVAGGSNFSNSTTAPVPEPGTLALVFAAVGLGLIQLRRRAGR